MTRILIVEDDPDVASLATRWLEEKGYGVEHVKDGPSAVEFLKNQPLPTLVLLDIMLPKMDGFEVLRRIRTDGRTKALPVVVITSFSRDRDEARAREIGVSDYIVKPLMRLDFMKRIEHILKD
jgi:chemosensory pili system protein ChpA (sensor histidine kinase/response regulator)